MDVKGQVLLVNPWIYDFAAYNLWIEPLGLLTIAAVLRDSGYGVTVVDCLAPQSGSPRARADGSGRFLKTRVDKPEAIAFVPRHYGRYGLALDRFEAVLAGVPTPDLVLVASGMTYWYPGVVDVIRRLRARFGGVPVGLGGVYASLCPDHARTHSGADWVVVGPGLVPALRLADAVSGADSEPDRYTEPRTWPSPAHGLVPRPFAGLLTSWGCPYRCTYCASHRLQPEFVQRDPAAVVAEIGAGLERGIRDFAFYDDALLIQARQHLVPILEGVLARGWQVRFHTPNGLHAGRIDAGLARLLRRVGFATVRLSLETADPARQRSTGGKVTTAAFKEAVGHLRAAGYGPGEVEAYLLAGLPDQPLGEVEDAVRLVQGLGLLARLALFSPIPGTPDGDRVLAPTADPLWHNNTVYPYLQGEVYVTELQGVKLLAKEGNENVRRRA
jgi:radical SAM superfamily enzyme YgiQ (UPF0313 family)